MNIFTKSLNQRTRRDIYLHLRRGRPPLQPLTEKDDGCRRGGYHGTLHLRRRRTHYARAKWAEKLGVSASGYYTWLQESEQRQKDQKALEDRVVDIFEEGEGTYGVDRICGILRRDREPTSYKVIQRIMHQKGLKSCHRIRRQRSLTDSRKARGDEYKNLTKNLVIDTPFQVISSDISYIRTGEGFDYLCQIRDVCTNTVLASS